MRRKKPLPLEDDDIPNIKPSDLPRFGITWCSDHRRRKIKNGEFPPPYRWSKRKSAWTRRQIVNHIRRLSTGEN
jgi:hypothetical protein